MTPLGVCADIAPPADACDQPRLVWCQHPLMGVLPDSCGAHASPRPDFAWQGVDHAIYRCGAEVAHPHHDSEIIPPTCSALTTMSPADVVTAHDPTPSAGTDDTHTLNRASNAR